MQDLIDAGLVRVQEVRSDEYVQVGMYQRASAAYANIKFCPFCGRKIEVERALPNK